MLPERLPLAPDPPEISDEDWAVLAQEVALTLALTVLAAYTGGAATPLVLARAARLASRMRGTYQAAARFIRTIKDPKTRETLEKWQESLEKAIKRVDEAVKRGEEKWKFGRHKSHQKWENQMQKRGWTPKQVDEAIQNGKQYPAPNRVNPKNPAIRYEHPETGRIVVRDETTKEIIQIGGSLKEGFKPSEIDDIFLRQENP